MIPSARQIGQSREVCISPSAQPAHKQRWPQGASACAILTLGKDLTFRDYAQGAYRMRGIGKGQTIVLFVIPEVARLCDTECAMGAGTTPDALSSRLASMPELERRRVELEGVAGWLLVNSMKSERVQFELWCQHCAQNVWRTNALSRTLRLAW